MWLLLGCVPCPCASLALPSQPAGDEDALLDVLQAARALYPDLDGVTIGAAPVKDLAYFRAWVELDTLAEDDGRKRVYTVQYDPVVLEDPPAPAALAAILAHELGHVQDYVGMDSDALLDFAAWYAAQDPMTSDELAAYERATDEKSLAPGCAEGLSAMRTWIYAHATPEVRAEKERNYYTPAEIEAWTAEHGGCVR